MPPGRRPASAPLLSSASRFLKPWALSSALSLVTRAGSSPQSAGALIWEGAWHLCVFWRRAVSHTQLSLEQESPSVTALWAVRGPVERDAGRGELRAPAACVPAPKAPGIVQGSAAAPWAL